VTHKVAIVGSRGFSDLERVRHFIRERYAGRDIEIVTGGARGVDKTAEEVARQLGLKVTLFLPDWEAHGRAAGPLRNRLIAEASDEMVAFWDGRSRGTLSSISEMRKLGRTVEVIRE
jgi:predicted Rossmann fold nucleotide-binding protein DprA/Smf involved in DNA uptake